MAVSAKAKLERKKRNRNIFWFASISIFLILVLFVVLYILLFSHLFNVKSFSIYSENTTFTQKEKAEIENILSDNFTNKNIFRLSEGDVSDDIKESYPDIKSVGLKRKLNGKMEVQLEKYVPAFVGCEKERQFLISCMFAEADGSFYKEAINEDRDAQEEGIYFFEIERDALSFVDPDKNTLDQKLNIDSLEGTRLYGKEEMKQIFAYLNYFTRNNYHIKKAEVKKLKILELTTDKYAFVLSLEKGFDETIKDFEIFQNNEQTKTVLKNPDLERIDLSYRDKVFYKLHVASTTETDTTSISTNKTNEVVEIASTTSTSSVGF